MTYASDAVRALSLTRPWPYAILHLGKRIENRSDKRGRPPMLSYRGWVLLHAAKSWDKGAAAWMRKAGLLPEPEDCWPLSAKALADTPGAHLTGIVGRARVLGEIHPMADGSGRFEDVDFDILHRPDVLDMRWWMGDYALALGEVEALPVPIPTNGRLGLWRPPAEVLAQLPPHWRWRRSVAGGAS